MSPSAPEPFFLVGSERSGTTLLRLMLSHHPDIECTPEFEFLVEPLADEGEGWPSLEGYYDWLSTNRIFLPHELEIDRSLDYPDLAKSFVAQFCGRSAKKIWGVTCHKHFDRLLRIWPRARFVHLVRDGRDVARSCIGMGWVGNVWYGAERWLAAERTWDRLCDVVEPERRLEVRYEDLVEAPEATLGKIAEFVGTGYDPDMLAYAESSTYGLPDSSLIYQWKRKLSPKELGWLEFRMGELLRRRGYEPSGVEPLDPGPVGRLAVYADHRARFYRFRRKKYGTGLLVQRKLADSLGLERMRRRVVLAMNEIDNRGIR